LDYIDSYTQVNTYDVQWLAVQDAETGQRSSPNALRRRLRENGEVDEDQWDELTSLFEQVDGRDLASNLPDVEFAAGRQLTQADEGTPVLVLRDSGVLDEVGIDVGDKVTLQFRQDSGPAQQVTFTIVGLSKASQGLSLDEPAAYAPLSVIPAGFEPSQVRLIVDMPEDKVNQLRRDLLDVPGAFVLETRLLNDLINRVLDTFTTLPILVAGLSLVTGGIVIANSVALSTMERRREIAIMKAVGLQRKRVLGMLLMENGLMGLIGGLIGVGIGVVILLLMLSSIFEGELGESAPYGTALLLMLVCVLISMGAALLSVWGASGEKPLKVLRYE
jgi:ABC-type lipoprotein release transport system permease subunit